MKLRTQDFYVSASKASKRKDNVRINEFEHFSFEETGDTRAELKKDLEKAEELYHKLEDKLGKEKLEKIANKIESLKQKLEENNSETYEPMEHEGLEFSPPLTEDLKAELDSAVEEHNIPEREQQKGIEKETVSEKEKSEPEVKLLHLAPPPPKD